MLAALLAPVSLALAIGERGIALTPVALVGGEGLDESVAASVRLEIAVKITNRNIESLVFASDDKFTTGNRCATKQRSVPAETQDGLFIEVAVVVLFSSTAPVTVSRGRDEDGATAVDRDDETSTSVEGGFGIPTTEDDARECK